METGIGLPSIRKTARSIQWHRLPGDPGALIRPEVPVVGLEGQLLDHARDGRRPGFPREPGARPAHQRVVPPVESDLDRPRVGAHRRGELLHVVRRHRGRLLEEDAVPCLDRRAGQLRVRVVRGRDHDKAGRGQLGDGPLGIRGGQREAVVPADNGGDLRFPVRHGVQLEAAAAQRGDDLRAGVVAAAEHGDRQASHHGRQRRQRQHRVRGLAVGGGRRGERGRPQHVGCRALRRSPGRGHRAGEQLDELGRRPVAGVQVTLPAKPGQRLGLGDQPGARPPAGRPAENDAGDVEDQLAVHDELLARRTARGAPGPPPGRPDPRASPRTRVARKSPVNRGSSRLVRALRRVIRGPSVYRKTATFRRGAAAGGRRRSSA